MIPGQLLVGPTNMSASVILKGAVAANVAKLGESHLADVTMMVSVPTAAAAATFASAGIIADVMTVTAGTCKAAAAACTSTRVAVGVVVVAVLSFTPATAVAKAAGCPTQHAWDSWLLNVHASAIVARVRNPLVPGFSRGATVRRLLQGAY